MGSIFPFPRLRSGPLQRLSSRTAPRTPIYGFLALAAVVAAAVLLPRDWFGGTPVPGRPIVAIDGDSLRYGNEEIRLIGIDAPEFRQTCRDERGREWACGREAHAQLKALLSRGEVRCTVKSRDRYGRALAVCSAGDVADLSEALVRAGYAIDFMNGGYRSAEADARAAKRGIWRGEFERPQEWRAKRRRAEG